MKPKPVAMLSKADSCSCLITGVAGSNPAEGIDIHLLRWFLRCGSRGLCEKLITRSEKSCRMRVKLGVIWKLRQ
jgi:hypothetical protein